MATFLSFALFGAPVSSDQAKQAVTQFLAAAPTPLGAQLAPAVRGTTVGEVTALGATRSTAAYAYVVALQPEGYIVVSADDRITPIIAFSASGTFDYSAQNPMMTLLGQDLPARLAAIETASARGGELAAIIAASQADWAKLTAEEGTRAAGAEVVTEMWVDSFVMSRWNQSTEGGRACYNYYTPLVGQTSFTYDPGNPDNVVCGCPATATAQMLRYFAWPEAGIGYKTGGGTVEYYYEFADPDKASLAGTQLRGGNGNGGPYDWSAMTLDPTGRESEHSFQQIGALCFDAGLSIGITYNAARSGQSGGNMSAGSFVNSFDYAGAGSAGGALGMRANFDARRPIGITIGMTNPLLPPPGGLHAIVGDGYGRIDGRWYYHFNMGWGGASDLWYNVEEYFYDSVSGGTEWGGFSPGVGNVYRRANQANENATTGKIISGRVTDAAGNPVPGVAVQLQQGGVKFLDMYVWNESGRNTTDENGIWAVDKVPNGAYDIVMTKDGLVFSGPKEVTVAGANQWGLNFIATSDTGQGEFALNEWYFDYDNLKPGAALVVLEFNRAIRDVTVDPTQLAINGYSLTGGVVFQSAASPLVVIVLNVADTTALVGLGGAALTLDMERAFLEEDVDGEGSQAGEDDAATVPVAPLVSGRAESPGSPIDLANPRVVSTELLVGDTVQSGAANPFATKEQSLQFLVTFSEAVQGVDADDFALHLTKDFTNTSTWPFEEFEAKPDTPLPSAVIMSVEPTDGKGFDATAPSSFWTVTVRMGDGDGFLRLDVVDNDTITSAGTRAATPLGGLGASNGDFFYSEFAYHFDNVGPVIVAATLAPDNTYVDITWSEPVGGATSVAKTDNVSELAATYRWYDTDGNGALGPGDGVWHDHGVGQDGTFYASDDAPLIEPGATGLVDGQARTGQFQKFSVMLNMGILIEVEAAHFCYVDSDGSGDCSAGDGFFLDIVDLGTGLPGVFDQIYDPGVDIWFWPLGAAPGVATAGTLAPDRTSYYADNGPMPVPTVANLADAETALTAWVVGFMGGATNGIYLDCEAPDSQFNAEVDTVVLGAAPVEDSVGEVLPANAMLRDGAGDGLIGAGDLVWLDGGDVTDALDGADTRLDENADPLPGVLFTNDLQVILSVNGGTVTSVGISDIRNTDGSAMTMASDTVRAMLQFTPDLDLGGAAPDQLNEERIPMGVETIEIVPVADSVFDELGNVADTQTTTGEMILHDSSVPRIVNVILADDNYSAKVVFSERVYTNANGISNHTVTNVPLNVGNLRSGDFTVTTNTGAVAVTSFSHSLGTNYCVLTFGGSPAGRQLVDPAANGARTILTVSVADNAIFDFAGNAVPATNWSVPLRRAYNVNNPDSMPPRCFTNGSTSYFKEPTSSTNTQTSTVDDSAGLTYYGIFYRDLDGDCRVDAVDLNFRNPRPTYNVPALSAGSAAAASKFRVWVQNNDPEDTSNAASDENLGNASDTDFTAALPTPGRYDWTEVTVTGASVRPVTTSEYTTIRVTIDQTEVHPRTHGKRWVMVSYDDPNDGMDGIPPTSSATTTIETDGVYWLYVTPTSGGTDPADDYWILADFPPTMAWDGAPARPVAATMWRTANYNKSGEADSYDSYDYMDVVFSEPLSSVGDGNWTPTSSSGSGTGVDEKKGPYGAEIVDLLSGTGQTVRIWFDNHSVTSRTFGGGTASANASVVDAAGNRNSTPHFTGTALGVQNIDSRYGVLGFRGDGAWVDMLAMSASGASILQYNSDNNNTTGNTHTLTANRVTLRGYDQGGFNAYSDAYWRQSNNSSTYPLAGILRQNLSNTSADIVFSAATNPGSVHPGDAFVAGITELRVRNSALTSNSEVPGMVQESGVGDGIFAMTPPAAIEAGPVYCMAKVSASDQANTSRLDERERAMLDIDVAGTSTDRIETITLRVIDTSYGQFDPEIDLLPLADDATSGMRLYRVFGTTALVQLAVGGLEWSEWRTNAEGQAYREVVLRPLAALPVPPTDLGIYAGAEYQIRVATSDSFNLGDSFIVEIPDDGILFRRASSQDDFPSNWAIADGTPGLALTGHVYDDDNGDGRWGMGETIMDIEDSFAPVPFYDAGVPYQHLTQSDALLSVVGKFQRNLYYAKRGSSPNPDTNPEPPGATMDDTTDTDYNVVYSPGDAVWYDIGGTLGVYDAGVDIPLFSNADLFRATLSPHEEGARSVQLRGAAPAVVSSALPAGTISAGSEPVAVLGIDMHDSGRGFAPRFPFGQDGGVVVEAVSKNLAGGVYANKLVYALVGKTLQWNGGSAVNVSAGGRYILEGGGGSCLVVDVTAGALPAVNSSSDIRVSSDVGRDIQQPAAIRGLRIHGVGPGNVPGKTGTLRLSGTKLSWESDSGSRGTAGAEVDVTTPGVYVLNAERVSEGDYLVVQVDSIHGAASENLNIYSADGRVITPLRTVAGLEIMAVSDVVEQGNYDFTWDGSSSLSWADGSPTNVTGAAGKLTLVPGNATGTAFVVVRRTSEPLPSVPKTDRLLIDQTRLLRLYVTVNDRNGFSSTHLKALTGDETSGLALYRDANANGVFDGPDVDEFVPLLEAPVFSGDANDNYVATLYPDPAYRAAYLPNSQVAPHTGNDFFLAVQTTYDMSYGDQFSVTASVYEPTEPRDDLNGNPSFASGTSGVITCTSVTNTVYADETSSPYTIDAGRDGVSAPQVLFGIDHFLGVTSATSVYVQGLTFTLHSANGFNPDDDLKAMDDANHYLRGVMLYADDGDGGFDPAADTLIPCDIVTSYNAAAGTYTFTMLPITSSSATEVPELSDGGDSDHFVCLNFSSGLDYGDELYATVEVAGIEYSSGVGNAASRLQTHNLSATIKTTYGDLTSRVQTTVTGGLLVTGIGSTVPDGYQNVEVFFDAPSNAYYLWWNGYWVQVDMLAVASYTIGSGNYAISVTFDPFAFRAEDTLVDGDGSATTAAGVPDDVTYGDALLPIHTIANLWYVDLNEDGYWQTGEPIIRAAASRGAYDEGTDDLLLGTASDGDPLTAFAAHDRLGVYDKNGDDAYTNGEDIVRDTDGIYTLPWLDELIDTDGAATAGIGGGTLLGYGDGLVSAHTVSVDAGAAVEGYAALYYYDADASGGFTCGDDVVARPAQADGTILGPLTFVTSDRVVYDGDDNNDGDDANQTDEVQVAVGDALSQFVAEDYVAFESAGIYPNGYELREDIFRALEDTYYQCYWSWSFRVTNGTRAIRRYEAAAPAPFNDPEDAMTAAVGIDLANSGATGVTLDKLTVRFYNVYQFNATIDLRALSSGRGYAGVDAGVLLYRDADGNGLFDPEIDTLVQPAAAPAWTSSGTEYRLTFNLDSDNLVDDEEIDGIYDFFVVVQPSAAANNYQQVDDGDRFRVRITDGDMVLSKAMNVTSIDGDTLVIDTLPPQLTEEALISDDEPNGHLDYVAFTFHEPLQPGNEDPGDWTVTDADGSDLTPPNVDGYVALDSSYLQLAVYFTDIDGTTGRVNCQTTYDSDRLGLFDWAGNPVDFGDDGVESGDAAPPIVRHSGIQLYSYWSAADGTAGISGDLYYHDRNGNGQWDAGEDIWQDLNGNAGTYDEGVDRRIWNGGRAWSTVDGYSARVEQAGLSFDDVNGNASWNGDEAIWVNRATARALRDEVYDDTVDVQIFPHSGDEVEVLDLDGDGRIDALCVPLSEEIDPTTLAGYVNHWTNLATGTWSLQGRSGLEIDPNGPNDLAATSLDGQHLYFVFNEVASDSYDSGDTPDLTTSGATLADLAGNVLNAGSNYTSGTLDMSDQALPVLVSATGDTAIVGGNIQAGTKVTLTFSERMAKYTELDLNDFVTSVDGVVAVSSPAFEGVDATLSIDAQGRVVITFNADTTTGDWTEELTVGVAPNRADHCVGDVVGHNMAEGGQPVRIKGMGSILVTEVLTLDTDANGYIDAMRITFDRPIDDTTLEGFDDDSTLIDVAANGDHFQVAGRDGTVFIDPDGPFDSDVTGNNVLYLVFDQEGGTPDTGTIPGLTVTADCPLRSFDNEPVDVLNVCGTTDGAAPQVMNVSVYDQDRNGDVDTVRLDFSESVADATVTPGDYAIGGQPATTMDTIRLRSVSLAGVYTISTIVRHGLTAGDLITIGGTDYVVATVPTTMSFTVATADDLSGMVGTDAVIVSNNDGVVFLSTAPGAQAPGSALQTVTYTQNLPADADTADRAGVPNLLADATDAGLGVRYDYAPPIVLAAESRSQDSIAVTFSEMVSAPNLAAVSANGGTISFASVAYDAASPEVVFTGASGCWNTGATGTDGDGANGTNTDGTACGDTTTDLHFAAAAVRDLSAQSNANAVADFTGTTDGVAPVAISATTSDQNLDGRVDQATVKFSEQVTNVVAGQFTVGGVAATGVAPGAGPAYEFVLTVAGGVAGTAYAPVMYTPGTCVDSSPQANPLATGAVELGLPGSRVDAAKPQVMSVATVDDHTIRLVFSEPIVNSGNEISTAVAGQAFALDDPATVFFGSSLANLAGTSSDGQGDLTTFYLRMPDTASRADGVTWNTDATGTDPGAGFDASGVQQTVQPQIHFDAGVLGDAAGNLVDQVDLNAADGAPAVVIEVTASKAQQGMIFGAEDNVFVKVLFSEALTYSGAGGNARLTVRTGPDPATAQILCTGLESDTDSASPVGLNRALAFTYEVADGDNRVYPVPGYFEYAGTGSLIANGATIQDGPGNTASVILPAVQADGAGTSLSVAKVELDTLPPEVASARTVDHDTVEVTFSEPVRGQSIIDAITNDQILLSGGQDYDEATTDAPGTTPVTALDGGGDAASYLVVYLHVTAAAERWNTDATGTSAGGAQSTDGGGVARANMPLVDIAAGVLEDRPGNTMAAVTFDGTTDGASPVVVAGSYRDSTADGSVDQALVVFSEPAMLSGLTGWSLDPRDLALNAGLGTLALSADGYTLTVGLDPQEAETGVEPAEAEPVLSFDGSGALVDRAATPNGLALCDIPLVDAAGPAIAGAAMVMANVVEVTFTETIDTGTLDAADFVHGTAAVTAAVPVDGGAKARLTLDASLPLDDASSVAFSGTSVVADDVPNGNQQVAAVAVAPLGTLLKLVTPPTDIVQLGADAVAVDGTVNVAALDLSGWELFFAEGHLGTPLEIEADWASIGGAAVPVPIPATLGQFVPDTNANSGSLRWTLVLRVAFANGSVANVYREIFVSSQDSQIGEVIDGDGPTDIDFQVSADTISASWQNFDEGGLAPASYDMAVGTTPFGQEKANWTDKGTATTGSIGDLVLSEGTKYYASIRALDGDGNMIGWQCSDGVVIDGTGPAGTVVRNDAAQWQIQNVAFGANWDAFADPKFNDIDGTASGVASYQMAVYKMLGATPQPDTDQVVSIGEEGFVDVGDVLGTELAVADGTLNALEHGSTYYAAVRAIDAVGNAGDQVAAATGVTVDLVAPVDDDVTGAVPSVFIDLTTVDDATRVSRPALRAYWDPFVDDVSGAPANELVYQYRLVTGDDPTAWTAASPMNVARQHFASVELNDGRLLVAGGWTGTRALASVEIFDPADGTWTVAAPLNVARMNASVVCLPDGTVVIGGGENVDSCLDTLEAYDPSDDAAGWAIVGTLGSPRTQGTVAVVDGAAWFMGGRAGGENDVDNFLASIDMVAPPAAPDEGWVVSGLPITLSQARYGARAVTLADERILVIGGETGTNTVSATVDVYDPTSGAWGTTALAQPRGQFAVCWLPGTNNVLVVGGRAGTTVLDSVEFFDGSSWQEVAAMGTGRYASAAAWIDGAGQVLVAGGYGVGGNTAACETYDPVTDVWTDADALTGARGYHGLAAFDSGLVLAYGGLRNYAYSKACETSGYHYSLTGWLEMASAEDVERLSHVFDPDQVPPQQDGRYIAQVRATDAAGNISRIYSSAGMVVDLSVPTVTITAPNSPTNVTPLVFRVEFSKPITGFASADLTIENATVEAFAGRSGTVFDIELTPEADGTVSLAVGAGLVIDAAGNVNEASNLAAVEYMGAAGPICTLTADGDIASTKTPVIPFTATFSHAVTGFEGTYSITVVNGRVTASPTTSDGGLSYTFKVTATVEGDVKVTVKAAAGIDVVGNLSQKSETVTVAYDLTAPTAVLTGRPGNPTNQTAIDVTVGGDGVVTYSYSLDGGAEGDEIGIDTAIEAEDLAEGEHTLLVWGTDAVGNKQTEATEYTWSIDLVAPTVMLTSLSGTTTFENPIRFRMEFDEDMADFAADSLVVTNGAVVDFAAEGESKAVYTFGIAPAVVRGYEMEVVVELPEGTVHDLAGNACGSAEQMVHFYTEPPARVTLVPSAAEVAVGDTFQVMVYVKELSDAANGFRGGPFDLQYSTAQAELDPAVAFDGEGVFDPASVLADAFVDDAGTLVSGSLDPVAGLINELGGGTTENNLGEGELVGEPAEGVLYATIPFVATSPGAFNLAAMAASAGLSLTPPVGVLPTELVDYGEAVSVLVTTDATVSVVGESAFAENGGTATVRVTLAHAATQDVTVQLALEGAAVAGVDYTASPAPIVIAAGETSATATFTGIDDDVYKGPRTVVVGIDSMAPVGYQGDGSTVELTITDDDALGDLTGDGVVGPADFFAFIGAYGTSVDDENYSAAADLNGDGVVNYYDFNLFIGLYGTDYNEGLGGERRSVLRGTTSTAEITLVAPAEVVVGHAFTVQVYVQTNDSHGFGGGDFDVSFPAALLGYAELPFNSGDVIQAPFTSITGGALVDGNIDDLFGGTATTGLGYEAPVLYAELEFVATGTGAAVIQSAAGGFGLTTVGNGAIDVDNVTFGSATVNVVANEAPVADDLAVETEPDTAVDCVLTASDANGDVLTFALPEMGSAGYPEHGTIELARDEVTVVYTPVAGFTGDDSFTFTVSDGSATDSGTVSVFVGGFESTLAIRREGGASYATLTYGRKVGASDQGLAADGDMPSVSGAFFQVAAGENTELSKDFRPLGDTTVWQLSVAVPAGAARSTWQVAWDGTGLPNEGDAVLMPCDANWVPTGEKTDLREAGSVDLVNEGDELRTFQFLVVVAKRVEASYQLASGWNLIGVPVAADAESIAAFLADERVWVVYQWSEAEGYTEATTLEAGRGYWVFAREDNVELTLAGIPQVGATAVGAGWNLLAANVADKADAVVVTAWTWNPASLRYARPDGSEGGDTAGVWVFISEDTVIWSEQ